MLIVVAVVVVVGLMTMEHIDENVDREEVKELEELVEEEVEVAGETL